MHLTGSSGLAGFVASLGVVDSVGLGVRSAAGSLSGHEALRSVLTEALNGRIYETSIDS